MWKPDVSGGGVVMVLDRGGRLGSDDETLVDSSGARLPSNHSSRG